MKARISPFNFYVDNMWRKKKSLMTFCWEKTPNVGNLPSLPHIWRPWSCELWCSRCRSWRKWLIALLGRVCDAKNNITWTNFQISQMISGYRSISPGQNIEVGHGGTGQLQLLFLIKAKRVQEDIAVRSRKIREMCSWSCPPGVRKSCSTCQLSRSQDFSPFAITGQNGSKKVSGGPKMIKTVWRRKNSGSPCPSSYFRRPTCSFCSSCTRDQVQCKMEDSQNSPLLCSLLASSRKTACSCNCPGFPRPWPHTGSWPCRTCTHCSGKCT